MAGCFPENSRRTSLSGSKVCRVLSNPDDWILRYIKTYKVYLSDSNVSTFCREFNGASFLVHLIKMFRLRVAILFDQHVLEQHFRNGHVWEMFIIGFALTALCVAGHRRYSFFPSSSNVFHYRLRYVSRRGANL